MIISAEDLRNTQYSIVKTYEKENMSFSEVLDDMIFNEYSRLENYYKDKFIFIKFKDEEVMISDNKNYKYIVFGKNDDGFFVINELDEIWLLPYSVSNYNEPLFINSSLDKFVSCYCSLVSIFFYSCSKEIKKKEANKIANRFKNFIEKTDEISLGSLFYQNYIYSIKNLDLPIHFVPADYIRSGRHSISI